MTRSNTCRRKGNRGCHRCCGPFHVVSVLCNCSCTQFPRTQHPVFFAHHARPLSARRPKGGQSYGIQRLFPLFSRWISIPYPTTSSLFQFGRKDGPHLHSHDKNFPLGETWASLSEGICVTDVLKMDSYACHFAATMYQRCCCKPGRQENLSWRAWGIPWPGGRVPYPGRNSPAFSSAAGATFSMYVLGIVILHTATMFGTCSCPPVHIFFARTCRLSEQPPAGPSCFVRCPAPLHGRVVAVNCYVFFGAWWYSVKQCLTFVFPAHWFVTVFHAAGQVLCLWHSASARCEVPESHPFS